MRQMAFLVLKLLLILILAGWVSLWVLKPTEFWTRKWKEAEEKATASIFGYNGLDFVVYTFPVIAMAIIGFIYLELKQKEPRTRQRRRSTFTSFSSPLFVNQWQYKLYRMATRCGLLAEACLALLLLPVLRGMSVFRLLGVQFEGSVRYHTWLGTAMVFFATLHSAGIFFIWGMKHRMQDEMWKWQRKGRIYLAGEVALITALVIWITSLPQIRRNRFNLFYYTHHLYIVFLVFFLFHGGDRHFYMVFPGVFLFALDKLLRIIQSRPETCVLSARVFPCKAIELTLPKDPRLKYTPASVIFLKIPSISKIQWHPFSVTSTCSVDEHTISVIVKCEGEWTSSLYDTIHDELDTEADRRKCIPVAVEGPYGPASLDFVRYNYLLLVAGGIGITPFVSIVREITSNYSRSRYPHRIQYLSILTLLAIMIRWKRVKKELQSFTDKQSKTTKESSLQASRDLDEHEIHFGGRPNFQDIFSDFTSETGGSDIGVLVCGPESMKESVASACRLALVSQKNAKGKRSNFSFHSLNFTL
ncbi:UNVERIFIED_CONTAM: Ferric reduction oxidase 8, mitochondrial [Sesamum calycinum]|uniref:Ferric reduction oxidase 8, mitochondrial n=1 Tax=Sesamum calycinum TaxID=2727403 RepID=A0AAW2NDS8_9LAMI